MKQPFLLFALLLLVPHLLYSQCPRQQALDNYRNKYLTSNFTNAELNWTGDISTCTAGTMSENVRLKHLQRINYYRELVGGLTTNITLENTKNQKSAETVLMFEAKNTPLPQLIEFSHCTGVNGFPCDGYPCNSGGAIEAASKGNIAFSFPNWNQVQPIDLYMLEEGDINRDVAHRRWILYSKAQEMGIATSPHFNAMWVVDGFSNPSVYDTYIAYPPNGYMPQPLMTARWSFGIPNADFSSARVTMQGPDGASIPVSIISNSQNFFGDNSIVWEPVGIDLNNANDLVYTVTILDIRSAPQSSYTYQTIIMPIVDKPSESVVSNFNLQPDGMEILFTDASTNATSWSWNFGDGRTSTDRHPVHAFDPGSYSVCLTATGACGSDTNCQSIQITAEEMFFDLGGRIVTQQNRPIEEVTVQINTTNQITDATGSYNTMQLSQERYTIRPSKNEEASLGISIADAIPIQRHILGVTPIPTPYQIIAADVNGSGTITTFDIVTLRRMILGTITEFPNGVPSWRFVPTDFPFPNPSDPFETGIPDQYTFELTEPRTNLDFIAIKIGDVNISALGSNFRGSQHGLGMPNRVIAK